MNWVGESGFSLPSRPVRTQFESFYRSSGAPILSEQPGSSRNAKIGQRTGDEQPVSIPRHATVSHLGKVEDALDHQKRMFALGAHLRFVLLLQALGRAFASLSTVIAFGLLSLSIVPVLHALGITVAGGGVMSLVFPAALSRHEQAG